MKSVLFMVRKEYFDAIERGEKTWEFRKDTKRWRTIWNGMPTQAVFMCGGRVMRRKIVGRAIYPNASACFGMPAEPERLAMLGDGAVLGFRIGYAVRRRPGELQSEGRIPK